ncbi:mannose-1-phosphate guanylyltransferase (GDP) [Sulfuricella denitrificans skB26]|uniref:mannose-1-phosphate guanylyltransferase n=1 Tax=Sulfuricella denitrificans (strain DSM 22764 / NBRC 105220 / skB26) TaxID=1163617 RepID=S6AA37_SULDS|nr:mannose-1-phosphate guanylyltransferase/mannose-6-phosphate isomerase [Sulfuricella denitrificans]BAN35180.1 mannose-1-phosphate guanylyltransferase (GDP) [Sulfuricella denitrificans skB26]
MLIPIILSGGVGARLWPISRESHPKPFMKLPDGQSLLQKTFARASALEGVREVLTITNREHYFKSRDEYQPAKKTFPGVADTFLLEPFGRNTAAAIALGALKVTADFDGKAIMLVLPADHLIEDQGAFAAAVKQACDLAELGKLVTFGIVPNAPETGFGYIEAEGHTVKRFVEKPSYETAMEYVGSGHYLWNSGMFCFQAGVMLEQFKLHAPSIYEHALACWETTRSKTQGSTPMMEIDSDTFAAIPENSIDYAVMEKSEVVAVVPGDFGWSDIGSWNAISDLTVPDGAGNRIVGEAVLVDVGNSYIQSDGRMVAAIGLDNLLIVDTPDALLVADRGRAQDVKKVVQQLKLMNHDSHKLHRTVVRPWGTYTVLEEGNNFKIKRIMVKPGASLSLQMHYHRSEHWIVVSGTASIVNDDKNMLIRTNESTYIPAGHRHRLENPGRTDLVMIEVQSGEYLGEDDIVRFDDVYGRT